MRNLALPVALLTLLLVATGRAGADGPPATPRFAHASLVAYPNAVIALRDPATGMTFYVESDGRRLVALDRDGKLAWGVDVLGEAGITPDLGEPVIRHLRLDGGALWATCGKSDSVRIEPETGRVRYAGRD